MNEKKIRELHLKVNNQLDSLHITDAINTVNEIFSETGLAQYKGQTSAIAETYRYMLHYLMEGVPDKDRTRMLADIVEQLRSLADIALRTSKTKESPDYYYSLLRFNMLRNERLSAILDQYGNISSEMSLAELGGNDVSEFRTRREDVSKRLFNALFTSLGSDRDYADLTRYVNSGYADENITVQSIAALTLSLLMYYDRGKMNALLDIYDKSESERVAARALVGIVLAMIDNKARVEADPLLMARLALWQDSLLTYRRLHEVVRVIVGTRDTERIAAKMKDEVIPELMKLRPEILKNLRGGEVNGIDPEMLENNPEWEEILSKSNLTKKMQELSEMQNDGADLMMVTFANLKQFPFFNDAANWFLPFDPDHSALHLGDQMRKLVTLFQNLNGVICDSDMYSLALASDRMPKAQMDMMSSQLGAQFDQMSEEVKSSISKSSEPKFDTEALKAVRDLYRFFKLFRKKEGLNDPFERPLQFLSLPVVGDMMSEDEVLRLIGEFYFRRGYYADALPMFETLVSNGTDDVSLMEKIGFTYQSQGDYRRALEFYDKAALLKTPGPWLVKKLAFVNRKLGNYEKAAEYYEAALEMNPDDVQLLMNLGNALLETGNYAGALNNFYHANYLQNGSPKILRAVAWTELLNGNFAKSSDYYQRILSMGANASDYLNAGHAALLQGQFKDAVNFYRLSAGENPADFELAFNSDLPTLERLGADTVTARLIVDTALHR